MKLYYVYALIDPRNLLPFYIGKGHGVRAQTHLRNAADVCNVHKDNKIAAIRRQGLEPFIQYLMTDIANEDFAYATEAYWIKYYGRKGYEPYGILSNICTDSRPPCHRGRTYEEIYGPEKAAFQKALRSQIQKARGGYGPKKHSEETRRKISQKAAGRKIGPMPESRKQKIRENRVPVKGADHYGSKHWRLISPNGDVFEQTGDLAGLCNRLGLSFATMHAAHRKKRIPRSGAAKGWQIESFDK